MFVVDDPMLALIVRFVASDPEVDVSATGFLERQVETMKQYLARYPEEEQEQRAIEWVARYAEEYRNQWQRKVVSRQAAESRCLDCPMNTLAQEVHCPVHQQWQALLRRYARNELASVDYVVQALQMLRQHKDELKVRKQREAEERRQLREFRDATNRSL